MRTPYSVYSIDTSIVRTQRHQWSIILVDTARGVDMCSTVCTPYVVFTENADEEINTEGGLKASKKTAQEDGVLARRKQVGWRYGLTPISIYTVVLLSTK